MSVYIYILSCRLISLITFLKIIMIMYTVVEVAVTSIEICYKGIIQIMYVPLYTVIDDLVV